MKPGLFIVLIMVITLLFGLFLCNSCKKQEVVVESKAAIVDQLYTLQPNQNFIDQSTRMLVESGYRVDIYRGDDVNVDFFRSITDAGYRIIIFRAHAGLLGSEGKAIPRTCVFTNESYTETKHIPEQLSGKLAKARINQDFPWVFAIGADFIKHETRGKFINTIVLMMGCSTAYLDDLASSFINKGASVYTGWNASIGLEYVDNTTAILIRKLLIEKNAVEESVAATMKEAGIDPDFGGSLRYFPREAGQKTVNDLLH